MATRLNIDKYLTTTEKAISEITKQKIQGILIINPANPPIDMMTTINIEGNLTQGKLVKQTIKFAINTVRTYINNYSLMYEPIVEKNK